LQRVISSEAIPIKMWLDYMEDGAEVQAKRLANLSFAYKHVAVMPDAHQGYGMPIGTVLATKGVIIPNAVGVDIGCGMHAVQTSWATVPEDILKRIVNRICEDIPVGFDSRVNFEGSVSVEVINKRMPDLELWAISDYNKAIAQLGTLGGGNHFIEIQQGSDGHVWFMIHSGSRNLGHTVATYWNKKASELNEQWHTEVPKSWQLAFLPLISEEGIRYRHDMVQCVEYAKANRKLMADIIFSLFVDEIGSTRKVSEYDVAHNYARMENHFGNNVMVHRKGATSAKDGEIGIIPGSMGTKSYIVVGAGNPESFMSCSHGAGRAMSRSRAKEQLSIEEQRKRMGGVLFDLQPSNLDEAPGAYKDIDAVMEYQNDLVTPIVELAPLAVLKG
jgi:tRNA-splicing ligase RtcB